MRTSRELRVFVSSTFRDLQEEREYLVKKVFPEIRSLCRQRGITFTEIDLRWGLTEEESIHGRIIPACLEEVERCRPYFLGIIGDRYGWIPSVAEVYKDSHLIARHPWVEEAVADGSSLMEIECEHGALCNPQSATGAFFYLRRERRVLGGSAQSRRAGDTGDALSGTGGGIQTTIAEGNQRLIRLIERIRTSGLPLREFRDPATLGELVYDDLCDIIERDFLNVEESPIERSRRSHEAFAQSRRRAYIPNTGYLRQLDHQAESSDPPLIIQGQSGSGKSALVAYWADRRRRRYTDEFIITHYIGIGDGTDRGHDISRRIMLEIADRLRLSELPPTDPQRVISDLPAWLALLNDERLVVVLDGVNQMPSEDRVLSWLPEHLPENVRLIVSTIDSGEIVKECPEWHVMQLGPLDADEREALVVRYLNEYHKSLGPEQVRRIARAPQSAHPLYLRTLLEELRIHGHFKYLDQQIDKCLAAGNAEELFRQVLERMEEDFGARRVRQTMRVLWASREGLTEEELAEFTSVSRSSLSIFLSVLDYHLLRRGGLYSFFHTYLADAVERRYLPSAEEKNATHRTLGRHFAALPVTSRRLDEEPWQWQHGEAWEELKQCITDPEMFLALAGDERKYELLRYWNDLSEHYDLIAAFKTLIRSSSFRSEQLPQMLHSLGRLLTTAGSYGDGEIILRAAVDQSRRRNGPEHESTLKATESLAALYYHTENTERAEQLLRQAIAQYTSLYGEEDRRMVPALSSLGAVLYKREKFAEEEVELLRALRIEESLPDGDPALLAELLNNLGTALHRQGRSREALEIFERALQVNRARFGMQHPEVANGLSNISVIHSTLGEFQRAEDCVHEAITINLKFYGPHHPATLRQHGSRAGILRGQGRLEDAERVVVDTLATCETELGIEHPLTIDVRMFLGVISFERGQMKTACSLFHDVWQTRQRLLGDEHPSTVAVRNRYLEVLRLVDNEGETT